MIWPRGINQLAYGGSGSKEGSDQAANGRDKDIMGRPKGPLKTWFLPEST